MGTTLIERISIAPKVCGRKPCIKGTHILVSFVLDFLAEGVSEAEILEDYSQLKLDGIRAQIACAAEIARERIVPVSVKQRGFAGSFAPPARYDSFSE